MEIFSRNFVFGFLLLFWAMPILGAKPDSGCWDFDTKVETPRVAPLPLKKDQTNSQSGNKKGAAWAAARAVVPTPIKLLYYWVLDHTQWKDMSKTELKTTELLSKHYVALHRVEVELTVFAFISLSWVEQWAYRIRKGTPRKPEDVLVSYQKEKGTSHIRTLCGNIILKKVDETSTDVYFYEESDADRYKAEDILNMHVSNLKILAKLKKSSP